jgi:hypothetical protein
VLRGPDHVITIVDLARPAEAAAAVAGNALLATATGGGR